jgi:hypothetical protein
VTGSLAARNHPILAGIGLTSLAVGATDRIMVALTPDNSAPRRGPSRRMVMLCASGLIAGTPNPAHSSAMKHVALLGDSVFDNAAYVGSGPDVARQVESSAREFEVTLLARDGATIADIGPQSRAIGPTTGYLVVSIGGNDALRASGVLEESASSVASALARLASVREKFDRDFSAMLAGLIGIGALRIAVCSIYEPRFPSERRSLASAALCLLNDAITRQVFLNGLTLIDLRLICDEDDDFANPIEPSVKGGLKIARAISRFLTDHPPTARVFGNS